MAVLVVINSTIGTGIFKTPARVARLTGSTGVSLALWAAGAVIAFCGAISLAELAAAVPRVGGMYEYLRRAYGTRVAFVLGWVKLTLLIPSATGSFAKLAAEALGSALGLAPNGTRDSVVAFSTLIGCAIVNLFAVRVSTAVQGSVTVIKYLGVLLLALAGLLLAPHGAVSPPAQLLPTHAQPTITGSLAALIGIMWAYDGWADLSSLAGEVKNPSRNLPRALALGTALIALVYLLANIAYVRVLGLQWLQWSSTGSNMAAANVALLTLGHVGRSALSVLVCISCIGGCMSSLLTGSRMFVPMATDRVFIPWLGYVSHGQGVPARAVVIAGVLGCAYVLSRTFEQLTEAFVVGFFPFYALAVGAVFVLRKKEPTLERPFRVPGYPVVPLLFLLGAGLLMAGAIAEADASALHAGAVLAVGVVLSFVFVTRAPQAA
jgi:amino acid transporter